MTPDYLISRNYQQQEISLSEANIILLEILTDAERKYYLTEHFIIAFGYKTASFLGYLIYQHNRYVRKRMMYTHPKHGKNWFYLTIKKAEERLHLTEDEQNQCIKLLRKAKILENKRMGAGAGRYFRLNIIEVAKVTLREDVQLKLRKKYDYDEKMSDEDEDDFSRDPGKTGIRDLKIPVLKHENPGSLIQPICNKNNKKSNIKKNSTSESANADPIRRQAAELSSMLVQSIKKTKPDAVLRDKKWIEHFEKILRIDKRSYEACVKLIEWLPTDDFWSLNILSAEKFRKQFDALELKMKKPKEKPKSEIAQKLEWKRINLDLFHQAIEASNRVKREFVHKNDFIVGQFDQKHKELHLMMTPEAFKLRFLEITGLEWEDD